MWAEIKKRLSILKQALSHGWTKILLPLWAILASYDLLLSEVIPQDLASKLPRLSKYLGMISWQGWFLIGFAISLIAIFEFAYKKSQENLYLKNKVAQAGGSNTGQRAIPRTVKAAITISPTDTIIRFDATAGEFTQHLPPIVSLVDGQRFNFQKIDETRNGIIFVPTAPDTILFPSPIVLSIGGSTCTFEVDLSNRKWILNP
jgi:hypothetical protein